MLKDKKILITGGTGSFGRRFIRRIAGQGPTKIIVFSRDEFKQSQMKAEFDYENIRFFIGDVRDRDRLRRAFSHVDYVIHAAALQQVPALEYCPSEAIQTNVGGAANIIEAALDTGVKKVVNLSTDKAVNPINLYGASKLCAEKLFTAANNYARTKFCSVRYGNVIGSRGSIIPLFEKLKERGEKEFPITDLRMTRFWLTLDEAVDLVLFALGTSMGGEIYVPKIPSMKVTDLARTIEPHCSFKEIGIRPGEKLHETLISEDNSNVYLVDGKLIPDPPVFCSNDNDYWLTPETFREVLYGGL
jgi:UDP-N-acetylglucosamine 4,6-dehydratase